MKYEESMQHQIMHHRASPLANAIGKRASAKLRMALIAGHFSAFGGVSVWEVSYIRSHTQALRIFEGRCCDMER